MEWRSSHDGMCDDRLNDTPASEAFRKSYIVLYLIVMDIGDQY
jgi:hypothetical protein